MKVAIDRYIEVTPDVRGGKPRIAGRRITIADVAISYLRLRIRYHLDENVNLAIAQGLRRTGIDVTMRRVYEYTRKIRATEC